jgi:hypothetical protein
MLKFARSSRLLPATGVANHSKPGWRSRVVELTTLVGYLAKFVDPSASHAWSGLSWSEDLGHLLMYVLAHVSPLDAMIRHVQERSLTSVLRTENTQTSRR